MVVEKKAAAMVPAKTATTAERKAAVTVLAENAAGGIALRTQWLRGLETKKLNADAAWMHVVSIADVVRKAISDPTSASRKMSTIV